MKLLKAQKNTLRNIVKVLREVNTLRKRRQQAYFYKRVLTIVLETAEEEGLSFIHHAMRDILRSEEWNVYDQWKQCTYEFNGEEIEK